MTPSGQTVCLCMIVKNEAHVIRRCLASVRPIIDHWIVVDTGSTDGTQEIVRAAMAGMPGEVVDRPWVDFAHNRSEALELARDRGDYSLIIDADDVIDLKPSYTLPNLDADSYTIDINYNGTTYCRTQIVSNTFTWYYRGVLHEFLECPDAKTIAHLPILLRINHDGARSTDPQTYAKDAAILERALNEETDPFLISRYTFYLAQSFRDCIKHEEALKHYLRRAELGFWVEEVYISLFQAGRMMEALGRDPDEIIAVWARASETIPTRAEAAHAASLLCRKLGRNEQGYTIAQPFVGLPAPSHGLFVQTWVYEYSLLDEFAVNAYWAGKYRASLDACLRALASSKVPDNQRERFLANAKFAMDKLAAGGGMAASASSEAGAHGLVAPRSLEARLPEPAPRVLLAILAKQKESVLSLFLDCIEALDYPKSSIVLYVRTNNNTDRTKSMLEAWLERVRGDYASVEYDGSDVDVRVEQFGVHEWNVTRFRVLNHIRDVSLAKTIEHECSYYFTTDCDNFLRPCTLRNLVATGLPIVAPLLRHIDPTKLYSNYHAAIDSAGYYRHSDIYQEILFRHTTGLIEMPVVRCTYVIRSDVISRLGYNDGSDDYDYVILSRRARAEGISQYFDNRQVYGYLTLDDDDPVVINDQLQLARDLLSIDGRISRSAAQQNKTVTYETKLVPANGLIFQSDEISKSMRIVASMTTIPSRIDAIQPVIEAVLRQSKPISHLEINIPEICMRTGEAYQIPEWLKAYPGVQIFRTEDFGPITKIAPTLLRYKNDIQTYIWSVDDDCAYPADQLSILCRVHRGEKSRILTRYGGMLNEDGSVQFWFGESEVTMLEGFGGVLYPPGCIRDDFEKFVDATSSDEFCRKNDDIVLAMYFNHHSFPIYLYNVPSDEEPYMVKGWLHHAEVDALSHAGHVANYKIIHSRVKNILSNLI